jgi:trimeric autotransporter adhesin
VGTYGITVTGVDAATGTITANAAASASVIAVPNPAFALTDSGSITISSPGATTGNTSTIIVTPSGGFNGAVNLSCAVTSGVSSATDLPTCTLGTGGTDSTSVNITGNGAQNALLTVHTIASTSARTLPFKKGLLLPAGGAGLALVFFFGLSDRRRRWQTLVGLFAICTLIPGAGCGGGSTNPAGKGGGNSSPGTTTGAYTVTISGTDAATGKMTQTVAVNVTIN